MGVAPAGGPASGSRPSRSSARLWAELTVAILLAIGLGLAGAELLISAVSPHLARGTSRLGPAAGAALSAGLLVASSRWAINVEHRLRWRQPVARTYVDRASASAPRIFGATRGRPGYGPVGTSVTLAFFVLGALACVAGAVSLHSAGTRSGYVQHHGTPAVGIVASVENTQSCSRGGSCSFMARITVRLPGVDGADVSVVHSPDAFDGSAGQRLRVLVDPEQPGYSELPGARFQNASTWIALVVVALAFAGMAAFDARGLLRLLAHRREHRSRAIAA